MNRAPLLSLSVALGAVLGLAGCGEQKPAASAPAAAGAPSTEATLAARAEGAAKKDATEVDAERAFDALAARVVETYLKQNPVAATNAGDHRFDARWPDLSSEGDAERRRFIAATARELSVVTRSALRVERQVDAEILDNALAFMRFRLDDARVRETDPVDYTSLLSEGIDPLVNRSFAPADARAKSLAGRLSSLRAVVADAKARLSAAPRVHTETAAAQARGLLALVRRGFPELVAAAPAQRDAVQTAAKEGATALEDLVSFFEKDLLPKSTMDFRIGRERFVKKLRLELDDDVSPEALVKAARALLEQTQESMAQTALGLWPSVGKGPPPPTSTRDEKKALVAKVLQALANDHPTNATILDEARKDLELATRFVQTNDLMRVPTEECRVIEMPEYRRGVAIAYCDSTGPLDPKQEAVYAIAPTPKEWPEKRALSFYREYNRSMLMDLTVHEAMPGHALQAMHAARSRAAVRALFASGPFVEGWAVYAEWLMAKHGFGGAATKLQREKMILRLCANALIDNGIHAGAMTEKEALDLMQGEAFQEEGEAVAKWKRARLSSAQLTTYFYGYTKMMELRAEAEKQQGFSERAYNDRVLSFGAPPMRHLKTLLASAP